MAKPFTSGTSNAACFLKLLPIKNMHMSPTQETGFILIREGALLPPDMALESESFLPGWRLHPGWPQGDAVKVSSPSKFQGAAGC